MRHANIIGLFDIIDTESHIYLVFEYCSEGDLEKYLKRNTLASRLSEKEATPIMVQLIDAMKYLHSCKIVHRDIKLANVLINEKFEIKLADFGFAKLLDDNSQLLESYCGTPLTMAPEILK